MEEVRVGDIILVDSFASRGTSIGRHSFVVIEDQNGEVCTLQYDFIALLLSSFKTEEQREAKLKYPGNFSVTNSAEDVKEGNSKDGFIKAEQFYYFSKAKTNYRVIGQLKPETLAELMDFIEALSAKGVAIEQIVDNL